MQENETPSTNIGLQFLLALLRRIENGELQVPEFQRGFVWRNSQIIELLRSIYKGYPIGTILLLEVADESIEIKQDKSTPFPMLEDHYPSFIILDGVQRLSTLYGVLINPGLNGLERKFKVVFDLRRKDFRHLYRVSKKTKKLQETSKKSYEVLLSDLFDPHKFVDAQKKLIEQSDSNDLDELIDNLFRLYNTFMQYQIPVTSIGDQNELDVFEIFEKINIQGTRLQKKQLPRAYR